MTSKAKSDPELVTAHRRSSRRPAQSVAVADRIAAFLDGRSQGGDLLHELYDYVLEEPIPPRIRALLKKNHQTDPRA